MRNYAHMMNKYVNKNLTKSPVSCAVVGARGYAGLELVRILLNHPNAELTACYATKAFSLAYELGDDSVQGIPCLAESEIMNTPAEVVFLATPAEVSLELAPKLVKVGKKVIDLSGAFRLKKHSTEEWYGFSQSQPELLKEACYGLWPFVKPEAFKKSAGLVANPGCYATAAALALIPLVQSGLIDENSLVLDGKSGATGAGRKAAESLLYSEVSEDCLAYRIGKHQHWPEIQEAIAMVTGKEIDFQFSTHLLPLRRGLTVAVYGRLNEKGLALKNPEQELEKAFAKVYGNEVFVSYGAASVKPHLLSLKKVVGTAKAHIAYSIVGNKVYVFAAIDNLLKGAASQAVESFNAWLDIPQASGLSQMRGQS